MGNKQSVIRLVAVLIIAGIGAAIYLLRPAANDAALQDHTPETTSAQALPRLLDLGADKCVPCKMMAPILEEMKIEFSEVFTVDFVDVWKNPDASEPYGLKIIPTQIFFDAQGKELFRHEGFLGREEILAKWNELGISIPVEES